MLLINKNDRYFGISDTKNMSSGYIYCLSNQCTSGIYKVSYVPDSHHHLKKLLDDMNSGNLPHPYVMEFAKKTIDAGAKMKIMDKILTKWSSNANLNANFYKMNLEDIKDLFELIDGEWDDYIDDEDDFDNASVSSFDTIVSKMTSVSGSSRKTNTNSVSVSETKKNSNKITSPLPSTSPQQIAPTSKSSDDDIFLIERTVGGLFINNDYNFIFMLTTSDRTIRCLGKLSETLTLEPLDKEDIVIVDKSLGIRYIYDTGTAKEYDFSTISRLLKQDSYVLTIDEEGKYILTLHTSTKSNNKDRDMRKYLLDGQIVRHVCMKDIWTSIYKSSDNCLHHDSGKYKSPSGFARAHIKACTGNVMSSINGWKICEAMIGNEWVILDSMKTKK
jgi:hypothetical protein